MRFMGHRITVKPDVTDFCGRHQSSDASHHAKTRAKHRDHRQLSSGDHRRHTAFNGRLHLDILQRQVPKRLISHQNRNLFYNGAELIGSGIFIPQAGNLMLNQRVIHDVYIVHMFSPVLQHRRPELLTTLCA